MVRFFIINFIVKSFQISRKALQLITRRSRIFSLSHCLCIFILIFPLCQCKKNHGHQVELTNETGYECWLRYKYIYNKSLLSEYKQLITNVIISEKTPIISSIRNEIQIAYQGLFNIAPIFDKMISNSNSLIIELRDKLPQIILERLSQENLNHLKTEGFLIQSLVIDNTSHIIITSPSENGLLYGTFRLLKLMQTKQSLKNLKILDNPYYPLRMVNHWDNPDGSIERGYGGWSIWKFDWEGYPAVETRYIDYSRLMTSLGINSVVINNVNTYKGGRLNGWRLITDHYLPKVSKIAKVFSQYGIKIYLSISLLSPKIIGELDIADPLNPLVKNWWTLKAYELKQIMPNFGGFLVKADSEGEKGPFYYGRTHVDGANMLAEALKPVDSIVIWRAFVYGQKKDMSPDRACQAYEHFVPFDGKFAENVIIQVKNGPIDFQVNEPVSSLFGAMPNTNLMMELQITQEYHGQSTHLNNLVSYWKEILDFDTYRDGKNSLVKNILADSPFDSKCTGIAGVINFGDDDNWIGHHLLQANTYGFGRLVWEPNLSTEDILKEWIILTFNDNQVVVNTILSMLLRSREIYANYNFPLGVGHMGWITWWHFRPNPWQYPDYHGSDCLGTGHNRTMKSGSGYIGQYNPGAREIFESLESCPEEVLLFFHHVPYSYKLRNAKTVIQHIYDTHFEGVEQVKGLRNDWLSLEGKIDEQRFHHVLSRINLQIHEAIIWRNIINGYYYEISGIPDEYGRKLALDIYIQGLENKAHFE